jgi:dUTP pyrophosphatase
MFIKELMKINVKKLNEKAIIPTQGHAGDAGFDLYACIDEPITIPVGQTVKIPTGLSIEIPDGYFGAIFARSGLATKQGLRPANCVGVCDAPYRGEYIVAVHNDSFEDRVINPNDRIAQLIIMPFLAAYFNVVEELSETSRGEGGFGSTGTN